MYMKEVIGKRKKKQDINLKGKIEYIYYYINKIYYIYKMSEDNKDSEHFIVKVDRQKFNQRMKNYYERNRETVLAKLKAKRDAVKEAKANGTYIEPKIKPRTKLEGDILEIKVNKEKFRITAKNYYDRNKDKINEKRREEYKKDKTTKDAYYELNKSEILEKARIRYQNKKQKETIEDLL